MATWSVATPPASYGEVDDGLLVRHVSVSASASLTDIKKAILKAYEDQYEPSQITLFTRKYSEPTLMHQLFRKELTMQPNVTSLMEPHVEERCPKIVNDQPLIDNPPGCAEPVTSAATSDTSP